MRFKIGKDMNEPGGFQVFLDDGTEITDRVKIRDLVVWASGDHPRPTVDLTVYATTIELADLPVEAVRIGPAKRGWRRALERLSEARISWAWPRFIW